MIFLSKISVKKLLVCRGVVLIGIGDGKGLFGFDLKTLLVFCLGLKNSEFVGSLVCGTYRVCILIR